MYAFAYIDVEQSSCLDFGKHKFGGPFTEEELEDVKTIFRILPLVVVAFAPGLLYSEAIDQFDLHAILTTTNNIWMCIGFESESALCGIFYLHFSVSVHCISFDQ